MRRRLMNSADGSNYLTIRPTPGYSDGVKIKLSSLSSFEYRIDGGPWVSIEPNTFTPVITLDQYIQFKGNLIPDIGYSIVGIGTFSVVNEDETGERHFNLEGNCMSLLFGDEAANNNDLTGYNHAFHNLFTNTRVFEVSPDFLPATTLSPYCYAQMFYGCRYMISSPNLPAMQLADSCYSYMFYGCEREFFIPPKLPATDLATCCYQNMFAYATVSEIELPATTLAESCYAGMFEYSNISTAPELPATELAEGCYFNMFRGCTNLNYIKMLATDISAPSCLSSWVYNVASTGTFVKHPDMTSLPTGTSGIPEGWTVVNDGE